MATIYSTQLIAVRGLSGAVTNTVPVGFVVVLRDLDVYFGGGEGGPSVFLQGSQGQSIWFNEFGVGGGQYASWRGRQVINAEEQYSVSCASPCDVTLSGYLLTAP